MTAARDRVVEAALAWVSALEDEFRMRRVMEVPTVRLDESVAAVTDHKHATAQAYSAERRLIEAVRALQKEAR